MADGSDDASVRGTVVILKRYWPLPHPDQNLAKITAIAIISPNNGCPCPCCCTRCCLRRAVSIQCPVAGGAEIAIPSVQSLAGAYTSPQPANECERHYARVRTA